MLQNSKNLFSKSGAKQVAVGENLKVGLKTTQMRKRARARLFKQQIEVHNRIVSIPIKSAAGAERVLKIVFSRIEESSKIATKEKDSQAQEVWERVRRMWQRKALTIERNFLQLNEKELSAFKNKLREDIEKIDPKSKDKALQVRMLTTEFEEELSKRARELHKRAITAGEGTALGSALLRAFAPWQAAASSAAAHTRGPLRTPTVKIK